MYKINEAQGLNDWLTRMLFQNEANDWPDNLVLFISRFEEEIPLLGN